MDFLKPDNLDFEKDIVGYNPKHKEKYAWIIHCIIRGNLISKKNKDGYVRLAKKLLRKFVGGDIIYTIIENLKQSEIIKVDEAYSDVMHFSKSYKLTEKYRGTSFTSLSLTGTKANRYIKKFKEWNQEQLRKTLNKQPDLQSSLLQLYNNVKAVHINETAATQYIDNLLVKNIITLYQYASYKWSIQSISKGELYFTRDDDSGRVFHNIANLLSEIRQFLSYNDKKLYQVDISNSQIVLFVPLLAQYLNTPRIGFTTRIKPFDESSVQMPPLPSPYINKLSGDALIFKNLTSQGKFYEYVMEQWKYPSEKRSEFKEKFFKEIFYSKNDIMDHYPDATRFQALFPTVYKAIVDYKRTNYTDLPICLQKIEAEIMINGICKRIEAENTEKPIFFITVHDSIVCLKKDIPYIQSIMEEELEKKLGFKTKVKSGEF